MTLSQTLLNDEYNLIFKFGKELAIKTELFTQKKHTFQ